MTKKKIIKADLDEIVEAVMEATECDTELIQSALAKFVVEGCDHPYHSVIGEGDLAKCLKCGQYCNQKGGDDEG